MTKEELASKLDGVEYRNELSKELDQQAEESGLLVIYGASDDLLYLGGVGNDELGCYDGGELVITKDGDGEMWDVVEDLEDEDQEKYDKIVQAWNDGNTVMVEWCEVEPYSWTYSTHLPHATFDVMEDGDKYCRGIVINVKDLK